MKNILTLVFLILFVFSPAAFSQIKTTTVAGVSFDNTVQVGGETLTLNGAGVRTKALFKMYVAGLYLVQPKKTAAEALALRGPKRLAITILRDISSDAAGSSLNNAFNASTSREDRARLPNFIIQFNKRFETTLVLKKGDVITLDWVPGSGLQYSLNDESIGEQIGDAGFYQAVLKVWLGDGAVDGTLKAALLQGIGAGKAEPNVIRRPGRPIIDTNR